MLQFDNPKNNIFIGTFALGRSGWPHTKDRESRAMLAAAWEQGYRHFDTALAYGKGHAERLLGDMIGQKSTPAFIASKIMPTNQTPTHIQSYCEQSLKNLKRTYIDLYQIHWPSEEFSACGTPIEHTIDALLSLQQQGKIRRIGLCNVNLQQLQRAQNCAPIASVQTCYSLFWRHCEQELYPYCQQHKIPLLAYSPLAQGLLCSNFTQQKLLASDHRYKNWLFQPQIASQVASARDQMLQIAQNYHCDISQLAIAWLHQRGVIPIVGARLPRHLHPLRIQPKITERDQKRIDDVTEPVARWAAAKHIAWDTRHHQRNKHHEI